MKTLKRILRILLYAAGGVILLLFVIAGLTQTQLFRDNLRSFALAELDSALIARVSLGEIHGNLVTGFQIDGMAMTLDGDTIVSTSHLDLQYDLFEIPGKTIAIQSLALDRPVVHMLRSHDGTWNLGRIAHPSTDTTTSRFDWAIMVKSLELRNGVVILVDSTSLVHPPDPDRPRDALDYDEVQLDNFWLALSFSSKKNVHTADIASLRFDVRGTPLHLRELAGVFQLSPTGARVKDMRIRTDSSDVRLQAALEGADLLGGLVLGELGRCSTMVDLTIQPLNFGELGRVLPPTAFLHGTVRGHLHAAGPFGALPVTALELHYGRSDLHLHGLVKSLHRPRDLALDVQMRETTIDPADPLALMPSFDLPDFRPLGMAQLSVEFRGTPLDFRTRLALATDAGSVRTEDFALAIGGPRKLRYSGTVDVRALDLSRMLDRPGLASLLNGTIEVDGAGVDLRRIYGTMHAKLDSSTFRGFAVRDADMKIDARDRKVDGVLQLAINGAEYHLTTSLNDAALPLPTFTLSGSAASVNLADFTGDDAHTSDLNMILSLTGHGFTLPTLGGDFHFDVTGSRYGDYPIEDGDVHIVLDQQDSTAKSLTVTSPVLDASLTGRFDIANLTRLVRFEVNNAAQAVRENFAQFDSTLQIDVDTVALTALRKRLQVDRMPVDCRYNLHVKDLQLVSRVVGKRNFDGMADLAGTLQGDVAGLTSSTRLGVKEFYYGDATSGLLVEGGSVLVEAADIGPFRTYADADMHIVSEARRLDISGTELDSASVDIHMKDRKLSYQVGGALNKDSRAFMTGEARPQGDSILCTIASFAIAHRDFRWDADPGATMVIGTDHIALNQMLLRRGEAQVHVVDGLIGLQGVLRAQARGTHLDLGDLDYVLPEREQPTGEHAFAGVMDADMTLAGTIDRPTFSALVDADSIALRGIPFGKVNGTIGYGNGILDLSVKADVSNGRVMNGPELIAEGSIPLIHDDGAPLDDQRQFRLNIRSAGTPIAILDPLLPNFNDLSGMLECDLTLAGTAEHPVYSGDLKLSDCHFLFEPNNMAYILNGTFHAAGDRIQVTEATLQNVPADEKKNEPGLVHLGGDFALRNFTPGDFNLTATGQLHAVKEATRKSALSMYGDLFVQIGPGGLKFTGNIDRSFLKGRLLIRNSSLIFPPTQQQVVEESALSVPIIVYDDTSKYGEKAVLSAADRYFGVGRTLGAHHTVEDIEGSVSFLDGLRYDLDIDATGGTTDIRMIFNPISSEELVATIDGKFSITEDGRRWLGDLAVTRAYYNFYRRFDAEGRITFTGDFMNPELDIRATYKGTRAVMDSLSHEERIGVIVDIKGPRQSPRLAMNMTIDEVDYAAYRGLKSNDVQSDVISFIIYGSFPLTTAERGEMTAEVRNTLTKSVLTGASSLLTGTLSEFLRTQTGIINQVELNWNNTAGTSETADIRLSGQAWNGYWRYGGQILDDPLGNANFSVLYSFGSIFNTPTLRNLMMELESKVERGTFGQINDLKRTNSARLFYRFSF